MDITIQSRNDSLLLSRIRDDTSKQHLFFFNFQSAHEAPSYQAFHLSSSLQMLNDYRMVDIELFGNFLCSSERIGFDDGSQLAIVNFDVSHYSSSSRLLSPWQNFLSHHCTAYLLAVPESDVLLILLVICAA